MNRKTSVALNETSSAFVERQIADGHFASADAVVDAGLKLLEEEERKLETLREALAEGEASGPPEPFDFDAFIAVRRPSR